MDHYQIIKNLHVTCVVLSISGFVLRGVWVLRGSPWTGHRLTRVLPHFVDTTLLASAVTLLYLSSYRPTGSDWLTFKLLGVLLYIVLGVVALRAGRTQRQQASAFIAALLVFTYVVGVALTGQRWPLG
ncbi:MAG: regulator SirB [Acidiferrobacteraceae bacterium]|jgi:uncharacterized membrane protein SirB2|nr:regulator SirB [Acidiferrobacteraceae bacterium]MCP4829371.1 SirB2 family protein [Pseudomonadota bacterium]